MNKGHTVVWWNRAGASRRRGVAAVAWVFGLLVLALSSGASAQAKPKRAPKVIELEEIKIEGRVQKPNAFYILNRSSIGYEVMELRTTFVQEVVHAVRRDPF